MTPSSTMLKTCHLPYRSHWNSRWPERRYAPALPDFRKLAIVDFLDKYEAASTGLIHNKPQSVTS
jgi:hypothetical protein